MGQVFSNIWSKWIASGVDMKMIMVGLDAAGKTTILYKLKLGENVTPIPTIGFNVEEVHYKNINFNVWDIGGQTVIRNMWRHYYPNTNGIIFVVDSNDKDRMDLARDELHGLLNDEELKDACLLIYANKQDIQGSMTCPEMSEILGLTKISGRNWYIQSTCALRGDGLYEGLEWLSKQTVKSK